MSSEKVVRKPTDKHKVARNLNTASLANLCLVSRHFRDVGLKLYYGKNTFRFSREQDVRDWALAIGSRLKLVRSIQLDSHQEVRFRGSGINSFELVCDQGIISAPALNLFPNLEEVHLSVGCAMQWQHEAFRNREGINEAVELRCWSYAVERANDMVGFLRDTELKSQTINVRRTLIFDGAFATNQSNDVDYRERMWRFEWKIRSLDAELPKRPLVREGFLPVVPGPFLPKTSGGLHSALAGAWTQKLKDDKTISKESFLVGVVHVHDICTKRAEWAGVMSELVKFSLPAQRRELEAQRNTVIAELNASNVPRLFQYMWSRRLTPTSQLLVTTERPEMLEVWVTH